MIRNLKPFASTAALAVLIFAVLGGCAPKKPDGTLQTTPDAAWKVFRYYYCSPGKQPAVMVKTSLHYTRLTPAKRTNRTLVTLWGDLSGAMRLDIAAGIGKLLAHIREDEGGLLVFYPTENKAYAHVNPVLGATRLGMPFPFSLKELSRVIVGDFSGLVPAKQARGTRQGDNFTFTLDGGLVSRVTLDATGKPIILEGITTNAYETARTWRLEINSYEDAVGKAAPLPGKLTLSLEDGETGVLYIKSRELRDTAWPADSLELTLPDDVTIYRLDNGLRPEERGDMPVVYEDK